MPSYRNINMFFLYFLLWQVLSVGCLSSDTSTESEIVLFPFPSGSPIEAQRSTASVEPDSPWSSEIPFTKVWNDDQEGVEESTTGNFFGFISTISLAPQTSLEDTWSTKTLTHEDEVVFPTATLVDEDSETLSEPETASETKTEATFEIPTLELPSVSSSLTGSGTSFTTLLRPTTTARESSTPEPTREVSAPSGPLSPGQIIGIVIGALASLVVVIAVILLLLYRRRKHRAESRRPTIRLVGGPDPDPTERGSQIYLPVMHRQVVDSRDLLAGGVRRSGSPSRRSDRTVSELSPSEAAGGRDTIDGIVDGYTSSVYSQESERGESRGVTRSYTNFNH